MDKGWWQITDFAVEISKVLQEKFDDSKAGVHYNTVDKWFKALETKRIHYVNRAAGEKVYDAQDLRIGCFIAEARRDNRFRLDVIYENIPQQLEVRPFPDDFTDDSSPSIDESLLQRRMMDELGKALVQQLALQEERQTLQINKLISERLNESLQKMLPAPPNKEEERANRLNDNLTRMKIDMKLEEKAIEEWNKLPEFDRTKRAGFFRKEEDIIKREAFIREYKKKNMEKAFKEEYAID